MKIELTLVQADPPVGTLRLCDAGREPQGPGSTLPFVGWLGLLHVLHGVVAAGAIVSGDEPRTAVTRPGRAAR